MDSFFLSDAHANRIIAHKLKHLPPDEREAIQKAAGTLLTSLRITHKKHCQQTQETTRLGIADKGTLELLWKLSTYINLKGEPNNWQQLT